MIPVQKFPYKVYFEVDEDKKIVSVKAILSDYLHPFTGKLKK